MRRIKIVGNCWLQGDIIRYRPAWDLVGNIFVVEYDNEETQEYYFRDGNGKLLTVPWRYVEEEREE